jgi:hypothetical protein
MKIELKEKNHHRVNQRFTTEHTEITEKTESRYTAACAENAE